MRNVKADKSNYSLSPQKKSDRTYHRPHFKAKNDFRLFPPLFLEQKKKKMKVIISKNTNGT